MKQMAKRRVKSVKRGANDDFDINSRKGSIQVHSLDALLQRIDRAINDAADPRDRTIDCRG